jgi:hypothetical protein
MHSGKRVWATESPNRYVAAMRGHWFHLTNRHESGDFMLRTAEEQLEELEHVDLDDGFKLRLRAIWYDDKHAHCIWYIDLLHPNGTDVDVTEREVAEAILWDGQVLSDGQHHQVDLRFVEYSRYSDSHDDDHYEYYEPWAAVFGAGYERPKTPSDSSPRRLRPRRRAEGRIARAPVDPTGEGGPGVPGASPQ